MVVVVGMFLAFSGLKPMQSSEHRQNPVQESKDAYASVMSHLEPDGDFLMILNAENGVKQASASLANVAKVLSGFANDAGEEKVGATFASVSAKLPVFLEDNGLLSLKAIGASVVPNGDGTFRGRRFVLRDAPAAQKPLWRAIANGEPRTLVSHGYLTEDVAFAASTTADPSAVLEIVRSVVSELVPELEVPLTNALSAISAGWGLDFEKALGSIDSDMFIALTLDESAPTEIPMDDGVCTIPEPRLPMGVQVPRRSFPIFNAR